MDTSRTCTWQKKTVGSLVSADLLISAFLGTANVQMYLAILLMGLIDYLLSDYLWARAVLLLGPTIVGYLSCCVACVLTWVRYMPATAVLDSSAAAQFWIAIPEM
jgi:drug/metabolite transporter (DMT)-like permease